MEQIAYDYKGQHWASGSKAKLVRQAQLQDELELLTSPKGTEYARFLGEDQAELISRRKEELVYFLASGAL